MKPALFAVVALVMAGCASAPTPRPGADSLLPGTIGIVVERAPAGVVVSAIGKESPAAAAGLRVGDIIVRYNGAAVSDPRQFYRLVVDSRPGSVARVEVLRDGVPHAVQVPVKQIDTTPRG